MLQMIDDLLDISSIEAGMLRLDRRPSDPHKLLEHNVGLNAGLAQQKHVHVSLQIEGALPRLSLDEWKIVKVLSNLISMAVKYSQTVNRGRSGRWPKQRRADFGSRSGARHC